MLVHRKQLQQVLFLSTHTQHFNPFSMYSKTQSNHCGLIYMFLPATQMYPSAQHGVAKCWLPIKQNTLPLSPICNYLNYCMSTRATFIIRCTKNTQNANFVLLHCARHNVRAASCLMNLTGDLVTVHETKVHCLRKRPSDITGLIKFYSMYS